MATKSLAINHQIVKHSLYLSKLSVAPGCSGPLLRKQEELEDILRENHPFTRPRAGRKLSILAVTHSKLGGPNHPDTKLDMAHMCSWLEFVNISFSRRPRLSGSNETTEVFVCSFYPRIQPIPGAQRRNCNWKVSHSRWAKLSIRFCLT